MEVKTKIDYCENCKIYSERRYGVENYNPEKLDLENYKKYKDLYVYRCPSCGNISVDLANNADATAFAKLKDKESFQEILDYAYLDGLDLQLFESHTESVPANLYEAYAEMQKLQGNIELYLRAIQKAIDLKVLIIQKYEFTVQEDDDEEDYEILDELTDLMYDSIDQNRKDFISEFQKHEIKNEFLCVMFIENLIGLEKYSKAKECFELLKNNTKIEKDLIKFVQNLFEEKE